GRARWGGVWAGEKPIRTERHKGLLVGWKRQSGWGQKGGAWGASAWVMPGYLAASVPYTINGAQLMPSLSVLLPVRDAARFLGAALGSLARQTFEDYEVIAVDDGSTDET